MNIINIIEKKRDKKELNKDEIDFFIQEYTKGNIEDYQAAALIMAIYINGMTRLEIAHLTASMANSGQRLDLSDISRTIVDKHSTGGVGDKITLIVMPIVAALGVPVAKMSGRGLGFTGGTADKLESIPGYKTELSIEEFKQNVKDIGISLITTNSNLAPADKKIYALRDTIGCTSSIPLIASSIMSKKIAAGADKIVLDITCGNGAFMKNELDAKKLAQTMIKIGQNVGKEVKCVITRMDEPVGFTIGNQLEVIEAVESLKQNMSEDIKKITYSLATQMLILAGKAEKKLDAEKMIDNVLANGRAYKKFIELVERQGGDVSYIEDTSKFKPALNIIPVLSDKNGMISKINTEILGSISVYIGAGRNKKTDVIDPQVGIALKKKIGDIVKIGEPLAYVHVNDARKIEGAVKNTKEAFEISNKKVIKKGPIIKIY